MDPEFQRFKRKYPAFPGIHVYIQALRRHNTKGSFLDSMISDLIVHAPAHRDILIEAYKAEQDLWTKRLLASVIAEVALPSTLTILAEMLQEPDESIKDWGERGLRKLDTKEARTILWQSKRSEKS